MLNLHYHMFSFTSSQLQIYFYISFNSSIVLEQLGVCVCVPVCEIHLIMRPKEDSFVSSDQLVHFLGILCETNTPPP